MKTAAPRTEILHASAVSLDGCGVLIIGPSGSGKSALALEMMSRGAVLIADDSTCVTQSAGLLIASVPASIAGRIEARGIGILAAHTAPPSPISLVVDLAQKSRGRLPEPQSTDLLGVCINLISVAGLVSPAGAIIQLVKGGRVD